MARRTDIYGGVRPEDVPAYSSAEAARLVRVPAATLRSWVFGRDYVTQGGPRRFRGLIEAPPGSDGYLTFTNVVEAHVLASMRRDYHLELKSIRSAIEYVQQKMGVAHPLVHERFKTDGADLFVEHLGELVNVTRKGQLAMQAILTVHLERIEYEKHRAVRFFPLFRGEATPRLVVVDPRRAFGRPVLQGTSVPVESVRARFDAGDSVSVLARDYEVAPELIEEALRATSQAA